MPKVNISPSQGWKVQPNVPKVTAKPVNMVKAQINGTGNMSQADAQRAAMDGAYHNTQMYGAPKL
jgi:hypothetical protein